MDQDARRTWLGLVAIIILVWAHGAWIAARGVGMAAAVATDIPALGAVLLGATSAVVALTSLTALAAGIEGFRPLVLVPALLTASSPLFAGSLFTGGVEPLVAALFLLGAQRSFSETHVSGRFPLSALLFGVGAALWSGGPAVLVMAAAQKVAFTRKFRLGRANLIFAGVWLLLGLGAWGALRLGMDIVPDGVAPPAGVAAVLREFWREVDGLAVLPLVVILAAGWQSKAVFFRLSLATFVLAGCLVAAATAHELPRALVPALPFAFLVVGAALAAVLGLGEAAGLRGRTRAVTATALAAAFALGQLWPTLAGPG